MGLCARTRQSCLHGGPRESAVSVPLGCTFPDVWTRNDEHAKKIPVFRYRHVASVVQKDKKATSLRLASEKAACARTYPLGEPKSKNKICSERKKKKKRAFITSPCCGFLFSMCRLGGCLPTWLRALWDSCISTLHWSYSFMDMLLQPYGSLRTQLKNCFSSLRKVDLESQEPDISRSEERRECDTRVDAWTVSTQTSVHPRGSM